MNESYKNKPKLIASCCIGAFLFLSPAIAENNTNITTTDDIVRDTIISKNKPVISNTTDKTTKTLVTPQYRPAIKITDTNNDKKIKTSLNASTKITAKTSAKSTKTQLSAPESISLQGTVSIIESDQPISLSLRDSDVKQVLRMLADKAGYNIIFHNSVDGQVTLDLINISLNKAFEYVMTVANLKIWIENDTIIVSAKDAAKDLGVDKQQITPIKIKYLEAGKVAKFLNKNIFGLNKPGISSSQIAVTNPRNNEVLIFGTNADVTLAKQVINHIDKKPEIKTFNVNHMTAGKMANLVCSSVFSASNAAEGDDPDGSGGGKTACTGNNLISGDSLESLDENSYSIVYYPDLGTITLMGATQEQIALTNEFIKKTDKKQPQVYIEMSIIELSEGGSKALSSTWGYYNGSFALDGGYGATATGSSWDGRVGTPIDKEITKFALNALEPTKLIPRINVATGVQQTMFDADGNSVPLFDIVPNLEEIKSTIPGGYVFKGQTGDVNNGWAYRNVSSPQYSQFLANNISALITQRKGRVLANPRIIATNNKESTVNLTSEYLKTNSASTESTSAGQFTTRSIEIGNAGIQITLKPNISPDGYIKLDISPTYSTIKEAYSQGSELIATFVNNRSLTLEDIRIKDGETLILGGLMQETEVKSVQKIPGLCELPIIGSLFRSTTKEKAKSELIIMVTPKIVQDEEDTDSI